MKHKALLPILAAGIMMLSSGCNQHQIDPNELPVTTKSDSAAQIYFQGLRDFDYTGSFNYLSKAIALDSSFFMACATMALVNKFYGNEKNFKKWADKAIAIKGYLNKGEKTMREILREYIEDPNADVSEIAGKLVTDYPDLPAAYVWLSGYQKDYQEAMKSLEKACELAPDWPGSYVRMSYGAMAEGDFDKAKEALDKYKALLPDAANVYDSYGDYYLAIQDSAAASESYMKAYELGMTGSLKKAENVAPAAQDMN